MKSLLILPLIFMAAGCAPGVHVIPKEKGIYEILAYRGNENDALEVALWKANKTCKKSKQALVVLDKSVTYHGVLTQEANKLAKNLQNSLSQIAQQPIPGPSTNEDYHAHLTFRCE